MTARAAQCKCGVHGFAMNPCESLPLATAPYCREARVTSPRRQTACGMRHCCARRIVECLGRRRLVCTSTRLAERQRMIEAEANRLAVLTRQRRAMDSAIGKHCSSSSCSLAMAKPFSWGIKRGPFSFVKENGPLCPCRPQAAYPSAPCVESSAPLCGAQKKELPFRTALFKSLFLIR